MWIYINENVNINLQYIEYAGIAFVKSKVFEANKLLNKIISNIY